MSVFDPKGRPLRQEDAGWVVRCYSPRPATGMAMAHVIFAVAVVFGSLVFGLPVSRADVATWCALIKGGEYWDCQYRSFEDCYSNVLGSTRGFCNPSPY